jgi:hypothetical protein
MKRTRDPDTAAANGHPDGAEDMTLDAIKGAWLEKARELIPDDLVAKVSPKRLSSSLAEEATRLVVKELLAGDEFDPPPTSDTLTDDLDNDCEPPPFRIDSLLREGQNLLIVAQYKVGKTTLTMQLLKNYCDGGEFLDDFTVKSPEGNVGVWNYELTPQQWRSWAKAADITNTDKAAVLHVRGYHIDLMTSVGADFAVEWLETRGCEVWIIDTYGAAYCGEENSNSDARDFLRAVENIARRAGVGEIIFTIHRGADKQREGEERARGATRVHDWTDVTWTYTRNGKGTRFLSARGRDVEHPEFSLAFDPTTKALTFGDMTSRSAERAEAVSSKVLAHVQGLGKVDDPEGLTADARAERSTSAIEKALGVAKDGSIAAALRQGEGGRLVYHFHAGRGVYWVKGKRPQGLRSCECSWVKS